MTSTVKVLRAISGLTNELANKMEMGEFLPFMASMPSLSHAITILEKMNKDLVGTNFPDMDL